MTCFSLFDLFHISGLNLGTVNFSQLSVRLYFDSSFNLENSKPRRGRGGGGSTWVNFCWVCAAGLSEPLPHFSLFCGQIIDPPILVTFWEMQFSRSQLSHFLFMPLPHRAFYFFNFFSLSFLFKHRTLLQYLHNILLDRY